MRARQVPTDSSALQFVYLVEAQRRSECYVAYSELGHFRFFNRDRFGRFIRRLSHSCRVDPGSCTPSPSQIRT